jgi:hypothetical protein
MKIVGKKTLSLKENFAKKKFKNFNGVIYLSLGQV